MPYPEQDQFGSKEEALAKAKVIGCYVDEESFHEMKLDDETFFMPCKTHAEYDKTMGHDDRSETRNGCVPDYIQANAQRGLDNLDKAGDGLVEQTIREAREMAKAISVRIN